MPVRTVRSLPETWVAIDFETATREANSACALGLAIVTGGRVTRTESWLIQPPFNEYEYRNTLIHGLGPSDTELAPDFAEVWWELAPLLAAGPLLAHNAAFDIRVLRALIASYELVTPAYDYACTVSLARKAFPELINHKLNTVCDHCGIVLMHHDAASDAAACACVALECAVAAGAGSIAEAVELLGVRVAKL